ncbi:MAG: hypothetical protein M3R36_19005 [Bacteroidota bacterium]|nr:hypothetical protein [Bacteroidota bacterium]
MSGKSKNEYLQEIYGRYKKAEKDEKQKILEEFCNVCGYNGSLKGDIPVNVSSNIPGQIHDRNFKLNVYDNLGMEIAILFRGEFYAGSYKIKF